MSDTEDSVALDVHRVTILVHGDEPTFEDYAGADDVLSVSVEAKVGLYNTDEGEFTLFDTEHDEDEAPA